MALSTLATSGTAKKGTFSASYTVKQDDVDTLSTIDNQASATGTPVTADTDVAKPSADSNTVKIPVLGSKSFTVAKALGEGESPDAKRKLDEQNNALMREAAGPMAGMNIPGMPKLF